MATAPTTGAHSVPHAAQRTANGTSNRDTGGGRSCRYVAGYAAIAPARNRSHAFTSPANPSGIARSSRNRSLPNTSSRPPSSTRTSAAGSGVTAPPTDTPTVVTSTGPSSASAPGGVPHTSSTPGASARSRAAVAGEVAVSSNTVCASPALAHGRAVRFTHTP